MEEIANERESETGLDSCGKIATRARILRENGHAGPAPAGERPCHPQRSREILRDNTRFAPEGENPAHGAGKKSELMQTPLRRMSTSSILSTPRL